MDEENICECGHKITEHLKADIVSSVMRERVSGIDITKKPPAKSSFLIRCRFCKCEDFVEEK